MYVPRRYETLDGRGLSLREMIYREGSPHQAAKRGELRMFRNSPVEIVEAHTEMLERVNGTWTGTAVGRQRQERVMQLYLDHPGQYHPLLIPEAFLVRHEYLLD
jgi:protoporphyrinogen oxidase